MSNRATPTKSGLLWVALAVAAIVGFFAFGGERRPPSEPPIVNSGSEYAEILGRAQLLSQSVLERYDSGDDLGDADKRDLAEAARLIEGLIGFRPGKVAVSFLAGKIYQALGNHELALERLNGVVLRIPEDTVDEQQRRMAAEARFVATISLERIAAFREAAIEAETALAAYPDNPNFLGALASARLQLGQLDAARAAVRKALRIDPEHPRSRQILKLLESAGKG